MATWLYQDAEVWFVPDASLLHTNKNVRFLVEAALYFCTCVCVCVCERARACVPARVCACACVHSMTCAV